MNKRILLVGATGIFGQRLANHIVHFDGIELILASRSKAKAEKLARSLKGHNAKTPVRGIELDHQRNLASKLKEISPWLVIDTSGPFQGLGYNLSKTALELGSHMVDLADARGYLNKYRVELGDFVQNKGLVAIAGASSTPALSFAVVATLVESWQRVDSIDICIAPAGRSEVGPAVIKAILSHAGKPVPIWKNGRIDQAIGWLENTSIELPRLGKRTAALVETIDAELLGRRYNVTDRVMFTAGLESGFEQWGIRNLARLRHHNLLGNLDWLAPLLAKARKLTRWANSDCGGMVVNVSGLDANGNTCRAQWSLLAEDDHGPSVPILPIAAVLRKLLAGEIEPGAHLACDVLSLNEIEREMEPYAISTQIE